MTNTKVYDGTTSAAAIPTVTGLKGTDTVTNLSETYNTPGRGHRQDLVRGDLHDQRWQRRQQLRRHNCGERNRRDPSRFQPSSRSIPSPRPRPRQVRSSPSSRSSKSWTRMATGHCRQHHTGDRRDSRRNRAALGTTTVTVSGGIGSFTNLYDNKAETIISLVHSHVIGKGPFQFDHGQPGGGQRLSITAPATVTAAKPFTIIVTAFDPYNNVATGYRGTIRFTSSDRLASLPNAYTFTAANNGVNSFVNGVTLKTTGNQTITATDVAHPSITGSAVVSVSGTNVQIGLATAGGVESAGALVREPCRHRPPDRKQRPPFWSHRIGHW